MQKTVLLAVNAENENAFGEKAEYLSSAFLKTVLFTEFPAKKIPEKTVVVRIPSGLAYGERRRLILEYLQNHFKSETYCVCNSSILPDLKNFDFDGKKDIQLMLSHPNSFFEKKAVAGFQKTLWKEIRSLSIQAMVFHPDFFEKVPFRLNADSRGFDIELLLQLWKGNFAVSSIFTELNVSLPFGYSEYCCFRRELRKVRLMQLELCYDFKYRIEPKQREDGTIGQRRYIPKRSPTSVHGWVLKQKWEPGKKLLDVGGGFGNAIAQPLAMRGIRTTLADAVVETKDNGVLRMFHVDLNQPWDDHLPAEKYDSVTALDILEHLYSPEFAITQIHQRLHAGGKLYASTGNIAFFLIRGLLSIGKFNYGNRGILDITHHRLFTLFTFRTLLRNGGFKIEKTKGFGPPLADFFPNSLLMRLLDRVWYFFANLYPSFFAYQILFECTREPDAEDRFTLERNE